MSKDKKKDKEFNELQLGEYFLHVTPNYPKKLIW